jgi:hypothetical protein
VGDLISRQAAIEAACKGADLWDGGCDRERSKSIEEAINAIPSSGAVKKGKWEEYKNPYDLDGEYYCFCSECFGDAHEHHLYCPNCGALMEGAEHETD